MALLQAKEITMDFGGVRAVNRVDLTIDEGTILGIIGPNGSGKTTFFNVLTGIYCPTGGEFTFDGEDITGWPPHEITQAGIARTFQNIRLFRNMSVLENVLVGRHIRLDVGLPGVLLRTRKERAVEDAARTKAEELLDFVGLADRQEEYAANLPYGEQRRLEIARALACDPRLILLDEPTAGMNHGEAGEVMGLIHDVKRLGTTILLIEHNMQVMMGTAEWIVALDAGAKIAEGTPKEIQYNERVIRAYLGEEE